MCYENLSSLKDNLNNLGFWTFLSLLLANIILLIMLCCCYGIKPIEAYLNKVMEKYGYINQKDSGHAFCHNYMKKLDRLIKRLNEMKSNFINNKKDSHNPPPKHKTTHLISSDSAKNLHNKSKSKTYKYKSEKDLKNDIENIKEKMNKKKRFLYGSKSKTKTKINQSTNRDILVDDTNRIKTINIKGKDNSNSEKNVININKKESNDSFNLNLININLKNIDRNSMKPKESNVILNIYEFDEAQKYEKRNFFTIYYIFLIAKQIIMHTIFYTSPIEPLPLRISLLLSIFQMDLGLNAFFYTDDKISERYQSAKNIFIFAFTNNLIVIIISTLIGYAFLTFFNNLNNMTNEIRKIFRKEEQKIKNDKKYIPSLLRKKEIILEVKKIVRKFRIKVIIFYIIQFIIIIFYLYYTTIFCFVYNKSQFSWLIDSIISIVIRFFIDLLIYLLFALLYKCSISSSSNLLYRVIIFLYCFG